MVARGAMWNASIFCAKGKTPWEEVKREYVRKVFNFTVVFVWGCPTRFEFVQKHSKLVWVPTNVRSCVFFCLDLVLTSYYSLAAEHIVGQWCEEHETYLERNDNALFLPWTAWRERCYKMWHFSRFSVSSANFHLFCLAHDVLTKEYIFTLSVHVCHLEVCHHTFKTCF